VLEEFIGSRTSGFLFQTKNGKPLTQRNIMRDSLHKLEVRGFHPFRRFRVTYLRDKERRKISCASGSVTLTSR
jgi:hypothetical protein